LPQVDALARLIERFGEIVLIGKARKVRTTTKTCAARRP